MTRALLTIVFLWIICDACQAIVTNQKYSASRGSEPLSETNKLKLNNKGQEVVTKEKKDVDFKPGFIYTSRGISARYRNDRRQMEVNMLAHRMGAGTGTVEMDKPSGSNKPAPSPAATAEPIGNPLGNPTPTIRAEVADASPAAKTRANGRRKGNKKPRGRQHPRQKASKYQKKPPPPTDGPRRRSGKAANVRSSPSREGGPDEFTDVVHGKGRSVPQVSPTPDTRNTFRKKHSQSSHRRQQIGRPHNQRTVRLDPHQARLLEKNFKFHNGFIDEPFVHDIHPHEKAILYEHARRGFPLPSYNIMRPMFGEDFNISPFIGQRPYQQQPPFPQQYLYQEEQSNYPPHHPLHRPPHPSPHSPQYRPPPLPTALAQTYQSNDRMVPTHIENKFPKETERMHVLSNMKPNMKDSSHNAARHPKTTRKEAPRFAGRPKVSPRQLAEKTKQRGQKRMRNKSVKRKNMARRNGIH